MELHITIPGSSVQVCRICAVLPPQQKPTKIGSCWRFVLSNLPTLGRRATRRFSRIKPESLLYDWKYIFIILYIYIIYMKWSYKWMTNMQEALYYTSLIPQEKLPFGKSQVNFLWSVQALATGGWTRNVMWCPCPMMRWYGYFWSQGGRALHGRASEWKGI